MVSFGKECGKEASDIKCVIEHSQDPELKLPTELSSADEKKNSVVHVH